MSKLVERGLMRQRAIQQSRGTAWSVIAVVLPIAVLSIISLIVSAAEGRIVSASSLVSALLAVSSLWIAGHLFREARRLGRLLKDPELIMRSERNLDLVSGVHWSSLNPFSAWWD